MPNVEQAEFWGGVQGEHWVAEQARFDRILDPYNDVLVEAAVGAETDHVLDVGCGNGSTTRALARAVPRGRVLGLDLSEPMVERARETAASDGMTNVEFVHGDAQVHPLPDAAFDAATSRFGVMFFDDPGSAFGNLRRALRPGGRLAFVCWRSRAENEWVSVPLEALARHLPAPEPPGPDEPGQFSLADPGRVHRVLAEAGFQDVRLDPVDLPTRVATDVDDAVWFFQRTGFGRDFIDGADQAALGRALRELATALQPYAGRDGVALGGAAWLVTAGESG